MAMSSTSSDDACKISMLWNWYTINTCFIAKSWHVKSKGGFAGSCIGCFFLVLSAQWLHRVCREYDNAIVLKQQKSQTYIDRVGLNNKSDEESPASSTVAPNLKSGAPELHALGHSWLFAPSQDGIYPNILQHMVRTGLFTLEWGLSYIIMLLFMYYNGYIIISCILGALVGKFIFGYEPLSLCDVREAGASDDRKCCG
ncbi:hypothetical protein CANARDRAFT_176689 [[Candida] arabinofermentans NRRL YB-2248]|uniref:Copper transport protein n=1 Tax=[Candida] arabinofermentans NRRL YB-2248 TaxID=983967 RepID=A0A1E4SY87_9ASCO|nr:hypothetical protein CANARDRAFT_176689 [[Candida] arabinofermentans NRRL YB-2248]